MAGNEIVVVKYLFNNINSLTLPHIGLIKTIEAPIKNGKRVINNIQDIQIIKTESSNKKADIYINGFGVSIKQTGGNFSFNRIQRANIIDLLDRLKFNHQRECDILEKLDDAVYRFHKNEIKKRNVNWNDFFLEEEFYYFLKYLMTEGSPNLGDTRHKADLILEAPATIQKKEDINVYVFDEYFKKYKNNFKIAIRRQWYGQASNSEHERCESLIKKEANKKWVFDEVAGKPKLHKKSGLKWNPEIPESERKTVYFLMIEKTK